MNYDGTPSVIEPRRVETETCPGFHELGRCECCSTLLRNSHDLDVLDVLDQDEFLSLMLPSEC
jgi:hypothetical protein